MGHLIPPHPLDVVLAVWLLFVTSERMGNVRNAEEGTYGSVSQKKGRDPLTGAQREIGFLFFSPAKLQSGENVGDIVLVQVRLFASNYIMVVLNLPIHQHCLCLTCIKIHGGGKRTVQREHPMKCSGPRRNPLIPGNNTENWTPFVP